MKIEFEIGDYYCDMKIFKINGIDANKDDFGVQTDYEPEDTLVYCCGNMVFERKQSTKDVLVKYKINEEEYQEICEKLEDGLSFGSCGLCE